MKRVLIGIVFLATILIVGTFGYMIISGSSFLDSLFMTVITISSVGYGEVVPLGPEGKWFTIGLILTGVSFGIYVLGQITEAMVEGGLQAILGRNKMEKHVGRVKDHYIICGFGRIGKVICKILVENKRNLVVIENNPEELRILEGMGYFFLDGNATNDEVLIKAGIERAKGLISVVSSDADSVYITLSARGLNPNLFIMARCAGGDAAETKLLRAGANKVVSPYYLGARRMAQLIVRPTVADFIDLTVHAGQLGLRMEEVVVSPESSLVNVQISDSNVRKKYDLIIVAIKRKDGEMLFNPTPQTVIQAGDIMIVLGENTHIKALEKIL